MTREIFIKKLETYQTSHAPIEVKEKAIQRLKEEFMGFDKSYKHKMLLNDISVGSAELRASELY